jgi:hypothetical protein
MSVDSNGWNFSTAGKSEYSSLNILAQSWKSSGTTSVSTKSSLLLRMTMESWKVSMFCALLLPLESIEKEVKRVLGIPLDKEDNIDLCEETFLKEPNTENLENTEQVQL